MKIILTRHGETIENREGRFMGHLPGKLSEKGLEQAKLLALRLKEEKIDKIFSSDLARASDTTNEVAKFHPDIPLEFTERIRERFLGEIQGVRKIDLGLDPKELIAGRIESNDGETQEKMFNRAKEFVDNLKQNCPEETILIIAHNGINLALTTKILEKPFEEYLTAEPQDNCAVTIFEFDKNKKPSLSLFNCTKHLS